MRLISLECTQYDMKKMFRTILEIKQHAESVTDPKAWKYFCHAAGQGQTARRNEQAFSSYFFKPRVMTNVERRDMTVTLLGERVSSPIQIGPTTSQDKAHPDGELATVKAADDCCMVLSIWGSKSLEEVAETAPTSLKWFQIHPFYNRDASILPLVQRAEKAGYKALVLTIDSRVLGREFALGIQSGEFALTPLNQLPNLQHLPEPKYHDPSATWETLDWLKQNTKLPIVVKGILTAESASDAVQHGADAIIVSNQGGRHLDGTLSSVEVLQEVVSAVRGRCEVYLDGGIRSGTDAMKALALGARAVFLGRPILWGLACDGSAGVKQVLKIMNEELDVAMGLCGCRTLSDLDADLIHKAPPAGYM